MAQPPQLTLVGRADPAKPYNRLLAALSEEDRALLASHLEPVALKQGDVLYEPYQPLEYVYFFESGLSSEIATNPEGELIEVGCVGFEGLSGMCAVLGVDHTPHRSLVQVEAQALRIRSDLLRQAMDASASLRWLLLRYVHLFMVQVGATALADGRYMLEQRLARWLLMAHDRMFGDELPLTHEFLSFMLGVRRAGVTQALHVLEGEQMIRAQRGLITVRNRHALEDRAAHSYGVPEAEYRRLIGPFGKGQPR